MKSNKSNIKIKKIKVKSRPGTGKKWDYFYHIFYMEKGKQYCIDADTLA